MSRLPSIHRQYYAANHGVMSVDDALRQLERLGLASIPGGNAYITLFMYANLKSTPQRCGVISIPIAG